MTTIEPVDKTTTIRTAFGWLLLLCTLAATDTTPRAVAQDAISPLKRAHAHNDYLHMRPLHDALAQGFQSVEADIFLVDGRLLVAHDRSQLDPARSLEKLYLDPLADYLKKNGGQSVLPGGDTFWLLIDIKSEAEPTYLALHDVLAKYADMLVSVTDGKVRAGAVQVVISGNRPQAMIAAQTTRYCGIDGRISDLDSQYPAHLMPMISDNWSLQFLWRGIGPIPDRQSERLKDIVQRAHARGRRVRFWATPENRSLWLALQQADVDLINTDDLSGLAQFLRSGSAPSHP